MAYTAWSVVAGEQPSAAKWNQLGSNDAEFNSMIVHSAGGLTTLNDLPFQNDNSNSISNVTADNVLAQRGWIQAVGSGNGNLDQAVSFQTSFDSLLLVKAGFLGLKNTTAMTSITNITGDSDVQTIVHVGSVTTSGFTIQMRRAGSDTFSSSVYYAAWWEAFGTKA